MEKTSRYALVLTVFLMMMVVGAGSFTGRLIDLDSVLEDLEGKSIKDFISEYNVTESDLDTIQSVYNDNIDDIPEVRDMLANERINLNIEGFGEFGIVNKDGKMESIQRGEFEDATLQVNTDVDTVLALATGMKEPKEALKDGSIGFYGVGFWNWLRFEVSRFFFGVASFFGLV